MPEETNRFRRQMSFAQNEAKPELNRRRSLIFGVLLLLVVVIIIFAVRDSGQVAVAQFAMRPLTGEGTQVPPSTAFLLTSTAKQDVSALKRHIETRPLIDFSLEDRNNSGTEFELKPNKPLSPDTVVTFAIKDRVITNEPYGWAYQVQAPFTITGTVPADKSNGVPINTGIEITTNRDALGSVEQFFTIEPPAAGKFQNRNGTLVFVPNQPLIPAKVYTVTVKKGLPAANGDTLPEDKVIRFETYRGRPDDNGWFSFGNPSWEFSLDQQPAFYVSTFNNNQSSVKGAVYRFSKIDDFVKAYGEASKGGYDWSRWNGLKIVEPPSNSKLEEFELPIENQMGMNSITLPRAFESGYYLLEILVNGEKHQTWFQVTDIANYLAVSDTQTIIWTRGIRSNLPLTKATIYFEGKKIATTNEQGIALFETPDELVAGNETESYEYRNHTPYLFTVSDGINEATIPVESRYGGFSKVMRGDNWWDYMFVDKTAYRPNDTLNFWGIVRSRTNNDPRGEELTAQITRPVWWGSQLKEATIYAQAKIKVSDFFTVTGNLDLKNLAPGMYQLSIIRGNEIIASENINVENYIKPAYYLELTPNKPAIFAGESVDFKIKARFFDQTPVANLQVKFEGQGPAENVRGTLTLNNDGEGRFTVPTKYNASYWPVYLSITVTPVLAEEGEIADTTAVLVLGPKAMFDVDQKLNNQTTKFTLHAYGVSLDKITQENAWGYNAYRGADLVNQKIVAKVTEITYTRTQIDTHYDAISKTTYPIYRYSQNRKLLRTEELTTGVDGKIDFEQQLAIDRGYEIEFSTTDTLGHTYKTTNYAWGTNNSVFSDYTASGVLLRNLRNEQWSYKNGELISLQLTGYDNNTLPSGKDNYMFVRLTDGIKNYQLNSDGNYFDSFKEEYVPNLQVIGIWFSGKRFHDSYPVNLSFNPEGTRKLSLTIKADKARYKPGEDAKLTIDTGTRDSAEINISALDQAAFVINPTEKNIVSYLYRDRPISVISRTSHLSAVESGAERGGCFLAGTLITTSTGSKPIEDMVVGDQIMTFESDYKSTLVSAPVIRTTRHLVAGYLIINDSLRVTANHRLFVNNTWRRAGEIKLGDRLTNTAGQSVTVKTIVASADWVWVYNIEIADKHTYLADGIYAHNEEKGGGEARGNFKDVAIFSNVQTGFSGTAEATIHLPDNLTSWRVTAQAITKDLRAGMVTTFIPVGLPFFVEAATNEQYLAGDLLTIRARAYGTDTLPADITYTATSKTLPFSKVTIKGGSSADLIIGQLTPGEHEITITAEGGGKRDALVKRIKVLSSYLTAQRTLNIPLANGSLPPIVGANSNVKILIASNQRGRSYGELMSLRGGGNRSDIAMASVIAQKLLTDYFNIKDDISIDLSRYQTNDGGISLLSYATSDTLNSALAALTLKQTPINGLDRKNLVNYLQSKAEERDLGALLGLAALGEPVLSKLKDISQNAQLTPLDKIKLGLALAETGSLNDARSYYREQLLPQVVTNKPYAYIRISRGDDQIVGAALLAILTAEIGENNETSQRIATYAFETPTTETLVSLERALYWARLLPNLKPGDVVFSYKTNLKDETKRLHNDEMFWLELTPDEATSLRFRDVEGEATVGLSYDAPLTSFEPDNRLSLSRYYLVNGIETNTLKDGDLVKIVLARNYKASVPGIYQITDYLPSGLRPVIRDYSVYRDYDKDYKRCVLYPTIGNNQSINFIDWSVNTAYCQQYYYFARVISRGTYKAEPAIIQSLREPSLINFAPSQTLIIK